MLLHGAVIAMVVAAAVLFCLCLSEWWLSWRCESKEERAGRRSQDGLPAGPRSAAPERLAPLRLWDAAADLSGGCLSIQTTPPLWFDRNEVERARGGAL